MVTTYVQTYFIESGAETGRLLYLSGAGANQDTGQLVLSLLLMVDLLVIKARHFAQNRRGQELPSIPLPDRQALVVNSPCQQKMSAMSTILAMSAKPACKMAWKSRGRPGY